MIINVYPRSRSRRRGNKDNILMSFLEEYVPKYKDTYDMSEPNKLDRVLLDANCREHFCQWLRDVQKVNVKSWQIKDDYGEIVAGGFDIADDALTMIALKNEYVSANFI